jgi:superfamily II DNA/RNA helicase
MSSSKYAATGGGRGTKKPNQFTAAAKAAAAGHPNAAALGLSKKKKKQQQQQQQRKSSDAMEDDDDDTAAMAASAAAHAQRGNRMALLDMIATSSSSSSAAPKGRGAKRPREAAADGHDNEEEEEEEAEEYDEDAPMVKPTKRATSTTHTSLLVAPSASSAAAAAASSASAAGASTRVAAAMPSAPAATGAGALFTDVVPALDPEILRVLALDFGFERMTPVQQQCIPTMLRKDVAVQSYTGSGKTLAFVLPMLQLLLNKFTLPGSEDGEISITPHTVAAIVLSPTRELATQICSVIAPFVAGGKHAGPRLCQFRLAQFIGGSAMSAVEADFAQAGGNIIVATPGRLNSTLGKLASMNVKELRVLILDEADRLLDEGFTQDITDILRKLPKQRRTGLFSATQTRQVKELRRAGLQDKFAKIDVLLAWKSNKDADSAASATGSSSSDPSRTQVTPTSLSNFFTVVGAENKLNLLAHFLVTHAGGGAQAQQKIIVFFLTGDQVDYYARILAKLKSLTARSLHKKLFALRGGKQGMEQSKRTSQLASFVEAQGGAILLATDVAARGIDVPDVDWIVQFDPPKDPSVFVHRIGRTARAGKAGSAIVYLTPQERPYVELVRGLAVPIAEMPLLPAADAAATADGSVAAAFEPNHSWKNDPDAAEIVAAIEAEKSAQDIEAIKKKQQKKHQHEQQAQEQKKNKGAAAAASASTADASSSSSGPAPLIKSVVREVRYMALEDRLLMDKAQRAYTSFVDGYKQHVMSHALDYTKLAFDRLAEGMGLLFLPRMPDLKHLTAKLRYDRAPIKAGAVRYRDPKMQAEHARKEAAAHAKNAAEQAAREAKAEARRARLAEAGPKRKKKVGEQMRDEWAELQNEARLLKKLKKGEISKKDFEIAVGERKKNGEDKGAAMGSDSDDDDDESDDFSGSDEEDDDDSDEDAPPPSKRAKTTATPPQPKAAAAGSNKKQLLQAKKKGAPMADS